MVKVFNFFDYKEGGKDMTPTIKSKVKEFTTYIETDIPIDPILIAKRMGIKVVEAEFNDPHISGLIKKNNEGTTIYVKKSDGALRKRFTVAHELGHLALHIRNEGQFLDSDQIFARDDGFFGYSDRLKEKQANQFAAELLMPEEKVRELWDECFNSPELMAAKFRVSLPSMKIRLSNLGLS